jgi:hypothetical protein
MLKVGTKVEKVVGDYPFTGVVVTSFVKLDGQSTRVVVENGEGVLHIFSEKQLMPVGPVNKVSALLSRLSEWSYDQALGAKDEEGYDTNGMDVVNLKEASDKVQRLFAAANAFQEVMHNKGMIVPVGFWEANAELKEAANALGVEVRDD